VVAKLATCILQIQQYLEALLNLAASISPLSFLRILKLSHAQTASLVEFLKSYDPSTALFRYSENKQNSSKLALVNNGENLNIQAVYQLALTRACREEHVLRTERGTIIDAGFGYGGVVRSLYRGSPLHGEGTEEPVRLVLTEPVRVHQVACKFDVFSHFHHLLTLLDTTQESLIKSKTSGTLFDRVKNQLTSASSATSAVTGNATATAQAAQAIMKYSGLSLPNAVKVHSFLIISVGLISNFRLVGNRLRSNGRRRQTQD
jgi:hypothetical protein